MTQKNCAIILGMHRSGASALAGCLNLMGFNLGNAIAAATDDSPGTFENRDIVLAHDILLRDLGCSWDMVGTLPRDWQQSSAAQKAEDTISGILERQLLNTNGPFAVKDPRMCRLMPLWNRVLEKLDVRPSIILLLRHPMEVAKSLQNTNSLDLLKGHLLWLVHYREALAACREHEHVLITFDQILADPVTALQNAAGLCALSDTDPSRHARDIFQFIRPEYKNFHQGDNKEIKDGLFRHYAWVYDQFRALQAKIRGPVRPAEEGDEPRASTPARIAEFPLAVSESETLPAADDRKNAAEVFDNLLSVIGRYEQAEHDESIKRQRLLLQAANAAETIYAQIFFPDPDPESAPYTEENAKKILLAPGEWQQIRADIPHPEALRKTGLRLCPLNTRGLVTISGVKLINAATQAECWSSDQNFSGFTVEKDALVLAKDNSLQIVATGSDPAILLPPIPELADAPMYLEIWIKPDRNLHALHDHWKNLTAKTKELKDLKQKYEHTKQDLQQKIHNHENSITELKNQLQAETTEKQNLEQKINDLEKQINDKDKTISELRKDLENQKDLTRQYFQALADAEAEQENLRQKIRSPEKKQDQTFTRETKYGAELIKSMERLHKFFQQFISSRRWKMGNAVVKTAALLTRRPREANSVNRMHKIFTEFAEWKKTVNPKNLSYYETNKLETWMNDLEKDFQALQTSRRLRLGSKLAAPLKILRWREKRPKATDNMKKIFDQYKVGGI
ncbi:MAG: hypothetical protein ACLFNW_13595 [Desulfobacterales bacterium]